MSKKIIISECYDPAYNLALEEYLIEKGHTALYLWQNRDTIVIGRNQNPYKECNIKKMDRDGIRLVRRKSGGGAVFHDIGNLNFTIISPKNENNISDNFGLIIRALKTLNLSAVFNGRNDLYIGEKKISGNAFYEKDSIFCHHGTLLIDVDMEKLSNYLTPSKLKLKSKGIDSVKSRVVNLTCLDSKINVELVKEALRLAYIQGSEECETEVFSKNDLELKADVMDKVNLYESWEWTYGQSPKSTISYEEKFDFGLFSLDFDLESGIIKNPKIYTDSLITDNFRGLEKDIDGKELKIDILIGAIEKNINSQIIKDSLIKNIEL